MQVLGDGTRVWRLDGQLHREDGPALEWPDGRRWWYLNGQRHRADGPAVEWPDGRQEWWLNGQRQPEPPPVVVRPGVRSRVSALADTRSVAPAPLIKRHV